MSLTFLGPFTISQIDLFLLDEFSIFLSTATNFSFLFDFFNSRLSFLTEVFVDDQLQGVLFPSIEDLREKVPLRLRTSTQCGFKTEVLCFTLFLCRGKLKSKKKVNWFMKATNFSSKLG